MASSLVADTVEQGEVAGCGIEEQFLWKRLQLKVHAERGMHGREAWVARVNYTRRFDGCLYSADRYLCCAAE